jgi:hypothetical protein
MSEKTDALPTVIEGLDLLDKVAAIKSYEVERQLKEHEKRISAEAKKQSDIVKKAENDYNGLLIKKAQKIFGKEIKAFNDAAAALKLNLGIAVGRIYFARIKNGGYSKTTYRVKLSAKIPGVDRHNATIMYGDTLSTPRVIGESGWHYGNYDTTSSEQLTFKADAETKAALKKWQDTKEVLGKLNRDLNDVRRALQDLPSVERQMKAVIARDELMQTAAGRRVLKTIDSTTPDNIKGLQKLLKA